MEKTEQENLDHLFQQLSDGQTPTFLEMMSAISDISEIYPESGESCDPALCQSCG